MLFTKIFCRDCGKWDSFVSSRYVSEGYDESELPPIGPVGWKDLGYGVIGAPGAWRGVCPDCQKKEE